MFSRIFWLTIVSIAPVPRRHFLEMLEVEAQGLVVEVRTFLLHVGAQHLAQGGVQQVRSRVVAFGEAAFFLVHAAHHGFVVNVFRQFFHDVV
jgi:hypothetical protein